MNVLVVEDSARQQASLGAGLRALGYDVDLALDSAQAIALASEQHYDIIILDLMLPKESSLLVLHEIRETDRDVEILILSTRDQIHDRVTALIQGADDYLIKPFSFDELHARIQTLVLRKSGCETCRNQVREAQERPRHLDRLIANLLQLCGREGSEIELVISEIKLGELLQKICANLERKAGENNIFINLSAGRLPNVLVDAKWMEHMLSNLIFNAIANSPEGSEIEIRVNQGQEYCSVEIEHPVSPGRGADLERDLSLVKSYTDYLKVELVTRLDPNDRFHTLISNIKIV